MLDLYVTIHNKTMEVMILDCDVLLKRSHFWVNLGCNSPLISTLPQWEGGAVLLVRGYVWSVFLSRCCTDVVPLKINLWDCVIHPLPLTHPHTPPLAPQA